MKPKIKRDAANIPEDLPNLLNGQDFNAVTGQVQAACVFCCGAIQANGLLCVHCWSVLPRVVARLALVAPVQTRKGAE